jgi:pSer/pThr/pTyr-binding forkhead associated (FHA) protein
MPDDLKQIDTSAIGELTRIREEEDRFRERLQKMESSRGTVSPAVFERVRRDYAARLEALETEARPLRERAREEYAKLRAFQSDAERSLQEVGLAKEELEFRNSLGEYAEADFANRLAACQQDLSDRKAWAEEIERMRDQFRRAFRSEAELEAAADSSATDATRILPSDKAAPPPPAPPGAPRTPVTTQVARMASSSQETVVASAARVVRIVDGKEEKVFSLRHETNTIGRHPKCEIELPFTEISRRHAEISLGPDGFRIVDLNSNNGVYVNGKKIDEQLLADGDLIQLGTQNLRFRA